jgi:hypothetical protein
MSNMTSAQTAEKPITVTTDEAISNFADIRQGRLAVPMRCPNGIIRSRFTLDAPETLLSA